MHAQNHNYERARELARTRAETFSTKIAKIAQKGLLHAKFGVQELCGKCKRPCKSLAQVQGLLHARAILKCSRPRARFESCTRASVQDKILSAKFSGLHHACTPLARLLHARNPKICSCAGCYCLLATMRLRNLPLHRCCNWTLHGFGRRRASVAPAKGHASPVSLETSHDKNTPDRIVSKGGGGRPAAWLYPVRVRTVLAAGAVSASRAVSVQHPPPFLTPAPPRAAPPVSNARALCPAAWRTRRACR